MTAMGGRCFRLIVACFLSLLSSVRTANPSAEQVLITTLLKNYDRNARPVLDRRRPTNVTFGLEVVQLVNVDDRNQMLTTNVWVRQRWRNELLTWKSANYSGVKTIRIDPRMVWIPDIVLYNSADSLFSGGLEKYKTRVILVQDGRHAWYSPASFRSTCTIDVTYFPFDEQTCTMKFGSWTFVVTDLDIEAEDTPTFSDKYVKSAEWDLIRASKKRNVQFYECCSIPLADVTIEMVIRRKPLFYVFNLITPCMIMLTMILLGFFLPPESGERITLSITVLLAMAVFLQLVAETLPRNSETIPLLGKFYITIMAEISMSLMCTCWVLNIHHRNSGRSIVKTPQWVEVFVLGWLAKILCVRKPGVDVEKISINNKHENRNDDDVIQVRVSPQDLKGKMSLNGEAHTLLSMSHVTPVCRSIGQIQKRFSQHNGDAKNSEEKENVSGDNLSRNLAVLTEHVKFSRDIEDNQKKWKHVAMVMDRFFFWFFILTVLTSTLVIFKERIRQGRDSS